MRKIFLIALGSLVLLSGCRRAEFIPETAETQPTTAAQTQSAVVTESTAETEEVRRKEPLQLSINDTLIPVVWEENDTVEALKAETAKAPIEVRMTMYGGNEQFGPLGRAYPRADREITTQNGDIVLYSGDQIVVFYGSNSWAYTSLGKINLPAEEVTKLLSQGDVKLILR